MSFPTFCDDFNIFFDDRFYNSYLLFLEAMVIYLFNWRYIVLGFTIVFDDVDVNRFMIIGIEQETISEEYKYCRHIYRG